MIDYEIIDLSIWQGRIDSVEDYDAFRWHQHIRALDLSGDIQKNGDDQAFVLIGYKVDEGIKLNSGRAGAAQGPDKVREFLCNKPCSFPQKIKIYDGGNVLFSNTVEQSQHTLATLVKKCLDNNYFPIVIGGGHDVAYGSMSGILKAIDVKKRKLGIINFDAHFDMRESKQSTSGTMFNQIYYDLMDLGASFNHYTIGIQKSGNTVSLFNFSKKIGSNTMLAVDLQNHNMAVNKYKLTTFLDEVDDIYVTVCSDVFASSYASGVSNPQPLGINPERFNELFKLILDTKKTIMFDIAEISPPLDKSDASASLGALIIYTLINYYEEYVDE